MERKILNIFKSLAFGFLFILPLAVLFLELFRTGVYSVTDVTIICNYCIIPFVSDILTDLATLFNITTDSIVILFFSYYISVFVYYLCIEILLILLEIIHKLFHYIERKCFK